MARLVSYFLLLSVITVALVGFIAYIQARTMLRHSILNQLDAAATLKADELDNWVEDQRREVLFITSLLEVRTQANALLTLRESDSGYQRAYAALSQYLSALVTFKPTLQEIVILTDVGGKILLSTDKSHEGGYRVRDNFFTFGRLGTYVQNVYPWPVTVKPTMTIATPLHDEAGQKRLGVLAVHLNLERMDQIILKPTGLGGSGEAYLVDRYNTFVSAKRFGRGDFPRGVHTVGIDAALQKKNGVGLYRNYAGLPVIGVYRWLDARELALLVEMNQKEAFAPARRLAWTIILVGMVSAGLLGVGVYLLARQIAEPILAIADTATQVAGGDLSRTAPVLTQDEIGLLAATFNRMTGQLHELYNELEAKVDERTAQLSIAKERAEEATRIKSEFLARMSHEIRTPMNAVIGLTNLTLKTKLSTAQRDYLTNVVDASQHLLLIINDILDFSKIEAGKMELESTHFLLHPVINKTVGMFQAKAAEKGIKLSYTVDSKVPLVLKGDALRLGQVLINMVSNAVKFTDEGEIIIRVELTPPDESRLLWPRHGNLHFYIRDSGVGIPPDKLEHLFQPFTQTDGSISRKYGGTGLGLSICQKLVTLMNGRIWVKSVPSQGSVFHFTLPLKCREEKNQCAPISPAHIRRVKILVVNESQTARTLLEDMLLSSGFDVFTTTCGHEGLAQLEKAVRVQPFDLVIVDREIPQMDGFQLAKAIYAHPLLGQKNILPKIIMVTRHDPVESLHALPIKATGIDSYLFKPINAPDLLNRIMEIFGATEAMVPQLAADSKDIGIHYGHGLAGARILLVEDNAINQMVAKAILSKAQLAVEIVENGKAAVDRLKAEAGKPVEFYDAVLMDIEMPEMDGHTAARVIRSDPRFSDLPIIAMTAHAIKGEKKRCLESGMDDYIAKPIDVHNLFAVLIKHIRPGKKDFKKPAVDDF